MENLQLGIRKSDGIFTLRYKEQGWNFFLLGIRNWDGTFNVRYMELGWNNYC